MQGREISMEGSNGGTISMEASPARTHEALEISEARGRYSSGKELSMEASIGGKISMEARTHEL